MAAKLALVVEVGERIEESWQNLLKGMSPEFTQLQAAHQPPSLSNLKCSMRLGLHHVATGDRVWGAYEVTAPESDVVVTAQTGDMMPIELWRARIDGPKDWASLDEVIQSHLVLCIKVAFRTP
jgi:hypothetical protein